MKFIDWNYLQKTLFACIISVLWLSSAQGGNNITTPLKTKYHIKLLNNRITDFSDELKQQTIIINGNEIVALTADIKTDHSTTYGNRIKEVMIQGLTKDIGLTPGESFNGGYVGYVEKHIIPANQRPRYINDHEFNNFPLFSLPGLISKCQDHKNEGTNSVSFTESFFLFVGNISEDIPGHIGIWHYPPSIDITTLDKSVTITCENIQYAAVQPLYYEYDCSDIPGTVVQGLGLKHAIVKDVNNVQRDCVSPLVVNKRDKSKVVWKEGEMTVERWQSRLATDNME